MRVLQPQRATKSAPVDADGTEVEDTGGAHHDVQGEQDVTVDEAEVPLPHHLTKVTYWLMCFSTMVVPTYQGQLFIDHANIK